MIGVCHAIQMYIAINVYEEFKNGQFGQLRGQFGQTYGHFTP